MKILYGVDGSKQIFQLELTKEQESDISTEMQQVLSCMWESKDAILFDEEPKSWKELKTGLEGIVKYLNVMRYN